MNGLTTILLLLIVACLLTWVVRRVIADEKGLTPIVVPEAHPAFVKETRLAQFLTALNVLVGVWTYYERDSRFVGQIFLLLSIMTIISGISLVVSKRTRDRARAIVVANGAHNDASVSDYAEQKVRRRGAIALVVGVIMFLIWCLLFGFSSLAFGVIVSI